MTDNTWEIYDAQRPFAGVRYGKQRVRMGLVGLGEAGLLAISPARSLAADAWQTLAQWGTPRFLLAPNHFHNLGIPAWKARFPDAKVVAHPRAIARLRKKLPGVAIEELAVLEAALPSQVRLFAPPMAKQGETWVSVQTTAGTGWFVTDALMNEQRLPGGVAGLLMRGVGFRAGLRRNPLFWRFFVGNRKAFRAWLHEQLERDPPVLFVPAHGQVLRADDLAERLAAAVDGA